MLTWAFRDQMADLTVSDQEIGSVDAYWVMDRVDGGGQGPGPVVYGAARRSHPDANAVWECVQQIPSAVRLVVIRCARSMARPDPMVGAKEWISVPVLGPRGKPKRLYDRKGKFRGFEMTTMDNRQAIEKARLAYAQWHGALVAIGCVLPLRLAEHEISGILAPAEPWRLTAPLMECIDSTQ